MTIVVNKYRVQVERDPINGRWCGKPCVYPAITSWGDTIGELKMHVREAMLEHGTGDDYRPPDAQAVKNRGRAQKRRGYRTEKRMETKLEPYGFERVVMSGALGGALSGDLRHVSWDRRREHDGKVRQLGIVEVKRRQGGHATLRRWLAQGGAHLLLLDAGGGEEPLAVLRLDMLCALLTEAGYGGETE